MNENFPNREPVIVRDLELHIIRRLPANAEVKVRAGERISADHVIARTDPRNLAVRISLADQLGVLPQDTQKHLLRPVGSTFKAGEAIAKNRKGLRNTVVASPMNGTLMSIDPETGVGMLAPGSGGDIRALVAGDVEYVDGRQTVAIRSVGSRIFGVAGLGPSIEGVLTVPVAGPGDELQAAQVSAEMSGKIVVAGQTASAATLRRLIEVGATGVIVGGLVEREISACLGIPAEDRLAPWRIGPTDIGMGDRMMSTLAIVGTEGFGATPICADVFSALRSLDGRSIALLTATRINGFLSRPQIIAVNPDMLDNEASPGHVSFGENTRVRVTDQTGLGLAGVVAERPQRVRRTDSLMIDIVSITTTDGKTRSVAANNVEVLA
ncbi:MAG TPA: hypothetical protein PK691_07415 [Thermomicrobiales bacterium]|nr:hypothetical protein [Thermomicrobiales bacterium]HRA48184.1 hypothetical protein [Thermomicrobiales bacterium]